MRSWQVITQTFSSSYLPVREEQVRTEKHDKMKASDRSKLVQVLQWLAFWKKKNGKVLLGEPTSTAASKTDILDTTALLSDEELEAEVRRILPPNKCPPSPESDLASIPQEFIKEMDLEEAREQADQDIFVSKARNAPLWKRLWRFLFARKQHGPLACHEDSNSTTDSTECCDTQQQQPRQLHPSRSHFSVSSLPRHHRSPHVTSDFTFEGTEAIEIEWPQSPTGADIAATLQQYLDRDQQHDKKPVEFNQVDPSDSKSVASAVLAVSFDNQEECAQLVFLNQTTTTNSEDSDVYTNPLGAQYPHPAAPKIPSVERQYVNRRHPKRDVPHWDAMDNDPPLETAPSSSSVEVSLTDYENNGGWSYDEDASFSSLLSSTNLFQPICRPEWNSIHSDPLFVPPSYFAGCFTHGPTLLDQAHNDDEEEEELSATRRSEFSTLPPPSLFSI